MNDIKTIGKQSYASFIARLVSYMSNLLLIVILARVLGPTDYGIFTLGTTIVVMFYTIFNLGVEDAIKYYVPKYNKNEVMSRKVFNSIFLIRFVSSLIGALVMIIFSNSFEGFYKISNFSNLITVFAFAEIGYSLLYLIPQVFVAFRKFQYSIISEFLSSIIKLGLMLLFINSGLINLTISYSASLIIGSIIGLIIIYKKVLPKIKNAGFTFKTIIKYSLINYVGLISGFITAYLGSLIIGSIPAEVSYLSIGNKIGMLIVLPASSFATALFPNISALINKEKIKGLYHSLSRYSLLISAFLSFYVISTSTEWINFFIGKDYLPGINAINVLVLGFFIQTTVSIILILYNRFDIKIVTYSSIIQGIASLILLIILTPLFLSYGAALAFTLSNVILMTVLIIKSRIDGYGYNISYLLKVTLVSITALSSLLFNGLIIKSVIFLGIFLLLGFMLKVINKNDIILLVRGFYFTLNKLKRKQRF